jgi:polyhydroxyalkanoate synthase
MLDPHHLASAALEPVRRAQFQMADVLRRAQGDMVAAFFRPAECPFQEIVSGPYWRLRDYGGDSASQALLIVAAPIKRPYIWDLLPSVSAICHCLRMNFHVYLLDWLPASRSTNDNGFNEYANAISDCVAKISADARRRSKPFLAGHSLGGTLAAIYGAQASDTIRGLVLLSAPLCFQPTTSRFRDALVSLVPSELSDADPFPGSLLSYVSALASPNTFIWSRQTDAALSVTDTQALNIHARVERWALDEAPLPGRLMHQIVDWLYRENRFCGGTLTLDDRIIDPSCLSVPTLAVVNTADEVAPLAAVKPFCDAIGAKKARLIEYPGELGTSRQHVAILVGGQAHARVWPEIFSWLHAHR